MVLRASRTDRYHLGVIPTMAYILKRFALPSRRFSEATEMISCVLKSQKDNEKYRNSVHVATKEPITEHRDKITGFRNMKSAPASDSLPEPIHCSRGHE
ncbi:hypothetical protein E2C01_050992 [Portunus trituberculatus]|uniref:Uncharacterized protein n=1 Tax=Portunus trituberculatus TaxID=210409 RepID=A0A5B7GKG7_PORTR|nr:hypothetical protein [Portunus trituberculatus]